MFQSLMTLLCLMLQLLIEEDAVVKFKNELAVLELELQASTYVAFQYSCSYIYIYITLRTQLT